MAADGGALLYAEPKVVALRGLMPLERSLLAHGRVVGPSAGRLRLHLSLPIGGDECGGVPRSAQRSPAQTDAARSGVELLRRERQVELLPSGSAMDVRQCRGTGCDVRPGDPHQPALSDESLDAGESDSLASCCPRQCKWYWRAVSGAELRSIQVPRVRIGDHWTGVWPSARPAGFPA